MQKYIKASKLREDILLLAADYGYKKEVAEILRLIDSEPTADVVGVVRCKDCDNWTDENGREGLCQVWSDFENSHYRYTPKNGYCSEGERKEYDEGDS